MSSPSLHPNLAQVAIEYDAIITRFNSGHLTARAAYDAISRLEARDDEGVRWSLDPHSGAWVRKNAFGDLTFDSTPPASGYQTLDAHTATGPRDDGTFNPHDHMRLTPVLEVPDPTSLRGATRLLPNAQPASAEVPWWSRKQNWVAAGIVVVVALVVWLLS